MADRVLRLGVVHRVEIRLDISVVIIFFLVVYSLGSGLFPQWHACWGPALTWGAALTAAVLLFASLLAHELAHWIMAQRCGIAVPRITLFLFGGISELERGLRTPGTEFRIAIVGPVTSLALGLGIAFAGVSLAGPTFLTDLRTDPEAVIAGLGPAATLVLWLGPINLMLALFNLIPGFPLDGGRVLRAVLWWIGGDLRLATERAAQVGRGFARALMALGVWEALNGYLLESLWLLLIGWVLNNAARSSYQQLLLAPALESLQVKDLMRTQFERIQAHVPLQEFIDNKLLRSDQIAWPVL